MSTTTRPRSLRLGAGLLDLLAGPAGIDGYLEQVKPTWSVRDCRAEVTDVRRLTPDSVTLTLRTNRAWQGFRAGQFVQIGVEIEGVRRTRCYSPASAANAATDLELTVKSHPEGLVSNFLIERARPGHAFRPRAGRRRLPPAGRATRPRAPHKRRQRHHPGDVDAADALRGGPSAGR